MVSKRWCPQKSDEEGKKTHVERRSAIAARAAHDPAGRILFPILKSVLLARRLLRRCMPKFMASGLPPQHEGKDNSCGICQAREREHSHAAFPEFQESAERYSGLLCRARPTARTGPKMKPAISYIIASTQRS